MAGRKILYCVNAALAVILLAAAAAIYWFAYRPLPELSGTVIAPVRGRAAIARDGLGVPHISAGDVEDALFLQGYATAQDRLWQMDALRRLASGELAEVLGPAAVPSDIDARRLRLRRIAEAQYRALPPEERAALAAYSRGVNFFLETHRGRLPVEFTILGYDPRPWSGADTLAIGMHMYRALTETWRIELQKRSLLAAGDKSKVELLFPVRAGTEVLPGSNAWAVAGTRTASGKPLLASDPHLEPSFPSIWHMVHLKAPGLNVAGVALPGAPCVIIGHNERIAWGVTNAQFDLQDLCAEKLDPQTGRYEFRGRIEQAALERDYIAVRGRRPIEVAQWVTRHGPVIHSAGNEHFALRWTAADADAFRFPFLDLNRARNWEEFRSALARYPGPPQNFVYADRDGNIGYQLAGRLPVRRNHNGDLPADGSSGNCEWDGYIPFDDLPRSYNPASGIIVSANQNPFPEHYPYRVSGNFAASYRANQIRALLTARGGWRAAEMTAVQKDVYSALHHFIARQVAAAFHKRDKGELEGVVAALHNWNGQMEKDQAAPLIAELAYQHLRKALVERAAPGQGLAYRLEMAPAVVEKLLRERPKDWFDDWDRRILEAFADAVEEARRMQGRNPGKWAYGHYSRLVLPHPVLGRLPLVGALFRIGPVPQSGAATTVKQTTSRVLPSMRMVADLADWERSLLNILTGESGHPLSPHFRDQWEAHYSGRSFPMRFDKVAFRDTLVFEPEPRGP